MAEVIYMSNDDTSTEVDICEFGECYEPKSSVRVSTVPEVDPEKAESD